MHDPRDTDAGPLAELRAEPENPHGFKGYGPLLALAVLVVLVMLLAPTVAPERYVLQPTGDSTTTTTPTSTTAIPTSTTGTPGTTGTTVVGP